MINFLKKLFTKPQFSTGAIESLPDARNIDIAQVQTPVSIPIEYKTDITQLPVENQLNLGTCVGQSHMKVVQYYFFKRTGKVLDLSVRAPYAWCKEIDGLRELQGTYPAVMAKVLTKRGIPTANYAPNNNSLSHNEYININISPEGIADASTRKLPGYVFIQPSFESVKQAIFQNGLITGVTDVDSNWFIGLIRKIFQSLGRHNTVWYGYDQEGIFARNSWGNKWIARVAKFLGVDGDFYFLWDDYKNNVYDIIAYMDIPEKILEESVTFEYRFVKDISKGMRNTEVSKLQDRLTREGFMKGKIDGIFGTITQNALKQYQIANGLLETGVADYATRLTMNKKAKPILPILAKAIQDHEGYIKPGTPGYPRGSRSYRNNNPGNIKYMGMFRAMATGQDDKGFCIFETYDAGFNALMELLISACSGRTGYNQNKGLDAFFSRYAPASDNNDPIVYAKGVAKKMQVDVTLPIKNFL